jgi:hypothetical protein
MSAMLEETEIALARAEHVIEARGRLSEQRAKIDRLKGSGEDALEAEQTLGFSKRTYLLYRDTEISFCAAAPQRRFDDPPLPAALDFHKASTRRNELTK